LPPSRAVSHANKDGPAWRDAFVGKCAADLQQGVGLAVIDIVTERRADLHAELLARLSAPAGEAADLSAAAYRPVWRNGETRLDIWHVPLSVGGNLPTLPLWLRGGPCVPLELESVFVRTCAGQRIP
jgi:hypothetical protein